jgi:hypothetical protein
MAFRKDWSARENDATIPAGDRKAVDILRQRYVDQIQAADRFKQHARKDAVSPVLRKTSPYRSGKTKHAEWIAEKIAALGAKLPEVPERRSMYENSWQYLLTDLEEENRCADPIRTNIGY